VDVCGQRYGLRQIENRRGHLIHSLMYEKPRETGAFF